MEINLKIKIQKKKLNSVKHQQKKQLLYCGEKKMDRFGRWKQHPSSSHHSRQNKTIAADGDESSNRGGGGTNGTNKIKETKKTQSRGNQRNKSGGNK